MTRFYHEYMLNTPPAHKAFTDKHAYVSAEVKMLTLLEYKPNKVQKALLRDECLK